MLDSEKKKKKDKTVTLKISKSSMTWDNIRQSKSYVIGVPEEEIEII